MHRWWSRNRPGAGKHGLSLTCAPPLIDRSRHSPSDRSSGRARPGVNLLACIVWFGPPGVGHLVRTVWSSPSGFAPRGQHHLVYATSQSPKCTQRRVEPSDGWNPVPGWRPVQGCQIPGLKPFGRSGARCEARSAHRPGPRTWAQVTVDNQQVIDKRGKRHEHSTWGVIGGERNPVASASRPRNTRTLPH